MMSNLIDSTDDFKAYRKALGAAVKSGMHFKSKYNLVRHLVISGLFGFLVTWAALAIYGAIKIIEKIGWM